MIALGGLKETRRATALSRYRLGFEALPSDEHQHFRERHWPAISWLEQGRQVAWRQIIKRNRALARRIRLYGQGR